MLSLTFAPSPKRLPPLSWLAVGLTAKLLPFSSHFNFLFLPEAFPECQIQDGVSLCSHLPVLYHFHISCFLMAGSLRAGTVSTMVILISTVGCMVCGTKYTLKSDPLLLIN